MSKADLDRVLFLRNGDLARVAVSMMKHLVGDRVTKKAYRTLHEVLTSYDVYPFEVIFALEKTYGPDAACGYVRAAKCPDVRLGDCDKCEREVPAFAGECLFCGGIDVHYAA